MFHRLWTSKIISAISLLILGFLNPGQTQTLSSELKLNDTNEYHPAFAFGNVKKFILVFGIVVVSLLVGVLCGQYCTQCLDALELEYQRQLEMENNSDSSDSDHELASLPVCPSDNGSTYAINGSSTDDEDPIDVPYVSMSMQSE